MSIFAGRKVEYLPTPEVFSQALYTLDIGQNDFTSKLGQIGIEGVKQFLPQVASHIGKTIKVNLTIELPIDHRRSLGMS